MKNSMSFIRHTVFFILTIQSNKGVKMEMIGYIYCIFTANKLIIDRSVIKVHRTTEKNILLPNGLKIPKNLLNKVNVRSYKNDEKSFDMFCEPEDLGVAVADMELAVSKKITDLQMKYEQMRNLYDKYSRETNLIDSSSYTFYLQHHANK